MKKLLALMLALCLTFSLFGCKKKDKTAEQTPPEKPSPFMRVASVTISNEGVEKKTYAISWTEEGCSFTLTESGRDPVAATASFHKDTRVFSIQLHPEGEDTSYNVTQVDFFTYDESQRIVTLKTPNPQEISYSISYDDQGWPQSDQLTLELDKEKMQYCFVNAGGMGEDEETGISYTARVYRVITLNGLGDPIKADSRTDTIYSNGERTEATAENIAAYTYDENGNLTRYTSGSLTVEFTYTKTPIKHSWERLIPLFCYNYTEAYTTPLFWNIK